MKLTFEYGRRAVLLPAAALAHLDKATKKDIRVLLELAADPQAALDLAAASAALAARTGISAAEIENSLAFWRGAGVVVAEDEEADAGAPAPTAARETPAVPTLPDLPDKGLPDYSREELSGILERRRGLARLIDDCQRAFGKIFNQNEISIIVGLSDFLGLSDEYILLLLTHCRNTDKRSLRYAEKMAIALYDEGIHDARDLEERLHRIEMMAEITGRIRTIFGITSRALTTKEKAALERWVCEMHFDEAMLTRAYEITVDSIGKASVAYADKILERWYADGYRTVEDVDKAIAEYQRKKAGNGSSFNVDEFFEAALRRTYGEG